MQVSYYELFAILFWETFGGFDRKMLPDIWKNEEKVVTLQKIGEMNMLKVYDDSPIQMGSEDQYGRIKLVNKLAHIINEKSKAHHRCFTIGIYGAWGEGKTSVLNLLKEKFNDIENVYQCSFNPWMLSDQESIMQEFFVALQHSLNIDKVPQIIDKIKRYGGIISYVVRGIGHLLDATVLPGASLVATSTANQIDKVRDIFPDRKPLKEQKEEINTALKASDIHIIVYIDDLDRLDKDEMRIVFRLIRQVADFDNVIYVIAMDHDMVTRSLDAFYEGDGNANAGQAFLEKIIQMPILLPRIQPNVLRQYATEKLMDILPNKESLAEVLTYLCALFNTKREWNRYLNQLSVVIEFGARELNMFDVCLIEAIKVFDPKVYAMIGQSKNALCSKLEVNVGHQNPFIDEEITDIQEDLLNSVVPNKRNVIKSIIKQLFPRSFVNEKEKHITKRICSKHYFDKYFVLDVLSDYISDEEIQNLRDEYVSKSDDEIINSIDLLLENFSYEEVNRALNMVVVRAEDEDRKNLAVKIMRILPRCKENRRYDYRYWPMSNHYAMELMINWVPDYLMSYDDNMEIKFDNDVMENLWNYWCANAPLPYCMELISNFNDVSFRGFERNRLKNGFDVLWKRLSDEEYDFAKFSNGYQIKWIETWRSVNKNALVDYILPTLLVESFDLRKYLLKNGKDQQGYKSFLNVIQEIVEPLSERVQKDYADSYKAEKPLRMLVDYASSAT